MVSIAFGSRLHQVATDMRWLFTPIKSHSLFARRGIRVRMLVIRQVIHGMQ